MLARIAKISIVPGQPFQMGKLDPAGQNALKDIPQKALQKIEANQKSLGQIVNGWVITKGLGVYRTDYMKDAGWPPSAGPRTWRRTPSTPTPMWTAGGRS
jgi:hypothetical protein